MVFQVTTTGKVRNDHDFVFFNSSVGVASRVIDRKDSMMLVTNGRKNSIY